MALGQKQYTITEFEEYIAQPENADRRFELINGEVVEKLPTEEHSLIVGNLYLALRNFVDPRDLGRVAFEVRRRMPGDDSNARLPDAEFTSKARLQPIVKKGAVSQMPDLAIEVKSPTDSLDSLRAKAHYYLANGSRMVWLVITEKRKMEVYTLDGVKVLSETDTIDGGDVLPGFTLLVADIFPKDEAE